MTAIDPIVTPHAADAFSALQQAWGLRPCIIRCKDFADFATPSQVFNTFQSCAENYSSAPRTTIPFRVWSGNNSVTCDVATYLPCRSDRGIQEYVARILQANASDSIFVMLNHLYMWDSALWARYRKFVGNIVAFAGIPAGGVDFDVICGRYKSTGFGVHVDDADNFTFVLHGSKTIYAWPPTFENVFSKRTANAEAVRSSAVVLTGRPGDVIYWPKTYWHVGESLEPSMTVQIAFYGVETLKEAIVKTFANALRKSELLDKLVTEHTSLLANERLVGVLESNETPPDTPTVSNTETWPGLSIQSYCVELRRYQQRNQGVIGVNFAFEE